MPTSMQKFARSMATCSAQTARLMLFVAAWFCWAPLCVAQQTCNPTPLSADNSFGSARIPLDAPIGSVIVHDKQSRFVTMQYRGTDGGNDFLDCRVVGGKSGVLLGSAINIAGLDSIWGNSVFKTNVPGIGLAVRFMGSFHPVDGSQTGSVVFPTRLKNRNSANFKTSYYLVKTGPIPSGNHVVNTRYEVGYEQRGVYTTAFTFAVTGTVYQDGCKVNGAAANQISVGLKNWDQFHFKVPGSTTSAVGFQIGLNSCTTGEYSTIPNNWFSNVYAMIEIEPIKGSAVIDSANGVFSLDSTSTASGVAIQLLGEDGITPLPIGAGISTALAKLSNGAMSLPLSARYIRTSVDALPSSGSANGAVNFTITYR